ncbi:aldehyde dehydrogenase (NADP(+)) [Paracrocinitomix mangrovi]|uniref:aldehyde dehydrogenase (NADP(+)) n=1 Tax=Paracrocinitomix mangrovi TaxID=2862509 RepID=UPI001C8EBC93|nr:aldehyde dehydrogenase (NADP(+)) [Paracrocinitomix mangrovi]UKN02280.1 aldehyde dehydrogenase (NADP(+)) [Paracrocinitomix mangrovi]
MQIHGKNHIGFQLKASGDKTFKTFDPESNADNEWIFHEAIESEINEAVSLAKKAFSLFKNIADSKRATFLRKIAENIENLGDELLTVYSKESGLPTSRAKIERQRTCNQLRMFVDFIESDNWRETIFEEAIPERSPNPKPSLLKTYKPLGPVVVFGASNFPFAYSTAGGDTASALASGCPVIVKGHPMHAGTGSLVADMIIKAAKETGMPEGVFSNLQSSGIEVGQMLLNHPGIKAVGFTGSIRGGRALMDLAAKRAEPIPVFAEMGSINPVFISPDSISYESDKWIEIITKSVLSGTGQFCTNPGLIIGIDSEELMRFAKKLASTVADENASVMLNPSIQKSYNNLREQALKQSEVIQLTAEGKVPANYACQTIATVKAEEFIKNPTLRHEVFGPYSIVVRAKDKSELIELIQNLEGQLTGTLILQKNEYDKYKELVSVLEDRVGRVIFNGVPTGVEVTAAMTHGGPYPASSDSRFTAVGVYSIKRWLRPVTYQNFPTELLPLND